MEEIFIGGNSHIFLIFVVDICASLFNEISYNICEQFIPPKFLKIVIKFYIIKLLCSSS